MPARHITLHIQPPNPVGEVTMVPALLSGRSKEHTARAMADAFADTEAASSAVVFNRLRLNYPTILSGRVASLGLVMERLRQGF